jgi:hypothetical protein
MAVTYYGVNAGGVWSAGATWSTISAKDVSRVGGATAPTNADTCILDDYSGNISVTGTADTCLVLDCTVNGVYAGQFSFSSSSRTITIAAGGTCTLSSSMTTSGTGTLKLSAGATVALASGSLTFTGYLNISGSCTINCGGVTWGNITIFLQSTITLGGALVTTGVLLFYAAIIIFSGNYNITCATFNYSSSVSAALVAGYTLTITTAINAGVSIFGNSTIKSATPGSDTLIAYNGTAANCKVAGVTFTDVDASSGSTNILNWFGGSASVPAKKLYTITNTDIPVVTDVRKDLVYGNYTGTMVIPATTDVVDSVNYDIAPNAKTGNVVLPATTDVQNLVTYGPNHTSLTGSYAGGGGGISMPRVRIGH